MTSFDLSDAQKQLNERAVRFFHSRNIPIDQPDIPAQVDDELRAELIAIAREIGLRYRHMPHAFTTSLKIISSEAFDRWSLARRITTA